MKIQLKTKSIELTDEEANELLIELLNLRMITTLKARYPASPIGYSGHEVGLATTCIGRCSCVGIN